MGIDDVQLLNTVCLIPLLALVTAVGNSIVLLAVWKDPLKELRKNFASNLIASLALSNLVLVIGEIMGAIGIALYASDIYTSRHNNLELAADVMGYFSVSTSVLTVLALATERFLVLKLVNLQRLKKTRVACIIIGLWVSSFAIACCRLIFEDRHSYRKIFFFFFVFILLTTICFYLYIFFKVTQPYKVEHVHACSTNGEEQPLTKYGLSVQSIRKRQLCAAQTILSIVGALLLLWMPTIIVELLSFLSGLRISNEHVELIYEIGLLNAAVDPAIYAFRSLRFRNAITAVCCCEQREGSCRFTYDGYAERCRK